MSSLLPLESANFPGSATMPWKSTFNRYELVACGNGTFAAGLPMLPRGKMLMFDSIVDAQPHGGQFGLGFIRATLKINPTLWFFDEHFKDDPVMPGCLGLDALWQLLGFFTVISGARGKGRAIGVGEVKFSGEVLPEHHLVTYDVVIKRLIRGGSTRKWIAAGDGYVSRDGEPIFRAMNLMVAVLPKIAA